MNRTMYNQRSRTFRPNALKIAGFVIGGIALAIIFAFIFGYFVMMLWNWLMPAIFGLGEITYWMAFGLIILARLIFGNIGSGHHKPDKRKREHFHSFFGKDKRSAWNNCRKWNSYDTFWEEEGEQAYEAYLKRKEETKTSEN